MNTWKILLHTHLLIELMLWRKSFGRYTTSKPFGYILLLVESTSKALRILPHGASKKTLLCSVFTFGYSGS